MYMYLQKIIELNNITDNNISNKISNKTIAIHDINSVSDIEPIIDNKVPEKLEQIPFDIGNLVEAVFNASTINNISNKSLYENKDPLGELATNAIFMIVCSYKIDDSDTPPIAYNNYELNTISNTIVHVADTWLSYLVNNGDTGGTDKFSQDSLSGIVYLSEKFSDYVLVNSDSVAACVYNAVLNSVNSKFILTVIDKLLATIDLTSNLETFNEKNLIKALRLNANVHTSTAIAFANNINKAIIANSIANVSGFSNTLSYTTTSSNIRNSKIQYLVNNYTVYSIVVNMSYLSLLQQESIHNKSIITSIESAINLSSKAANFMGLTEIDITNISNASVLCSNTINPLTLSNLAFVSSSIPTNRELDLNIINHISIITGITANLSIHNYNNIKEKDSLANLYKTLNQDSKTIEDITIIISAEAISKSIFGSKAAAKLAKDFLSKIYVTHMNDIIDKAEMNIDNNNPISYTSSLSKLPFINKIAILSLYVSNIISIWINKETFNQTITKKNINNNTNNTKITTIAAYLIPSILLLKTRKK
jgi:hypothetical protein